MANVKEIIEDRELCKGVMLSRSFFDKKENRLLTLFIKGFIVYLLSMGSIGFYLSALKIEYNVVMCHAVIFVMAMICAMLYYRLLVENIGYLVLLVSFAALIVLFRRYINSGFYAIVNITVDNAAQYFDVDIQRLYNEQIGNRYLTVTCVALFIGIVLDILLNVYISRRMQYVTAIFIVMSLNVIPLYMVMEPDMLYAIMLLSGMAMAFVFKSGKHYSPQVSVKRNDNAYAFKGRKKNQEIAYVYDIKAMLQAGITAVCFAVVMVTAVSALKPKESFNTGYQGNKYKDLSMAAMSTLLVDGWSGFFRMSNDTGGMNSGKLGDVSTIHLDYQTDLMVQVTPYSYDSIYLKSFTGEMYNPYENNWTSIEYLRDYDTGQTPEADALEEGYHADEANTSKGIMRIRNVGGEPQKNYLPYYYKSYEMEKNGYLRVTYYPRVSGNISSVTYKNYTGNKAYTDADLYVPEENLEAVEAVVDDLGFLGTDEQIIEALKAYYQENIPYTVRPGKTPRKADFINYFLSENRKGYCAHYASAAVLIFRYLGIPARYAEGYAVDYYQILDGEMVEDAEYSDYYDGYSELGETALIQVNVTDADAHAWVEVYSQEKGWYVVDVTPSSSEEEDVEDFWTMFADFMDDTGTGDGADVTDGGGGFKISDVLVRNIIYGILGIACLSAAVWLILKGRRYVIYVIRYSRAGTNDRLVMKYAAFCRRLARRDKEFGKLLNYSEQVEYIAAKTDIEPLKTDCRYEEQGNKPEKTRQIIEILEQAGFSNREISEDKYEMAAEWIKSVSRWRALRKTKL